MPPRLHAVTFDARDPERLAQFWADLLERDVVTGFSGPLLPGEAGQLSLGFAWSDADKTELNRMHLHLTSSGPDAQQQTVSRALELGARHVDVGQLPEEGHVVLGDPEDNELCVIEAGNAFLDGCGFLGELACDGTREVGRFWSRALGWALVWDENEETAVQSPEGGTKLAWGGPPVAPKNGMNRQRFELTTDGPQEAEVDWLVTLGATPLEVATDDAVWLADPDGNEFLVHLTRDALQPAARDRSAPQASSGAPAQAGRPGAASSARAISGSRAPADAAVVAGCGDESRSVPGESVDDAATGLAVPPMTR